MHMLRASRVVSLRFVSRSLPLLLNVGSPNRVLAQASPFMTGATALQSNARVAREYLVALPAELDAEQRLGLVRTFSRELTERYRFALDVAVHAPRDYPGSDPRNFHAHLLATTREVSARGLTGKTALELSDAKRAQLGLKPAIHELLHVRERWAAVTNEALREAGVEARIDHRTLAAQGIDREPYPYIPRAAFEMERHGYRSAQAEHIRAEYRARVAARLEAHRALERAPEATAAAPPSLAEIRRQARDEWWRLRQEAVRQPANAKDTTRDDDWSL